MRDVEEAISARRDRGEFFGEVRRRLAGALRRVWRRRRHYRD